MPVEDLLDQARQVLAAARPATSPADGNDVVRQAAGAAAAARIDALSAIYAVWARTDLEVLRFRSHPMFTSGLMEPEEVGPWILQQRAASAPGGNADQYLLEAFARSRPGAARPLVNLWYAADGQERIVAVDVKTVLGDLAKLADLLAGRYRWRPSGATMFVLTDSAPEVYVYSGSASVRGGATAATTTVTMALDPALTPDQVAGIYSRLKAKVQPSPPPRSLSVKHYRLAQHVGPHVTFLLEEPARITRPGRRAGLIPTGWSGPSHPSAAARGGPCATTGTTSTGRRRVRTARHGGMTPTRTSSVTPSEPYPRCSPQAGHGTAAPAQVLYRLRRPFGARTTGRAHRRQISTT